MFSKSVLLTVLMLTLSVFATSFAPSVASADVSPHCAVKPVKVRLGTPANAATLAVRGAELDWEGSRCADSYGIIIRRDSPKGPIVAAEEGLTQTNFTPNAKLLPAGHSYFWQVKACNRTGCSRSEKFSFIVTNWDMPPHR